ncbi:Kremen protein 1 [Branchiostoma belcheri]|nr:Kremen protein 1 [Branchiostoma belcheri]
MAAYVRTTGGRLAVCVLLFLAVCCFLVPLTGAGCPTVRLSGSTSLYPELFIGTYSMTGPQTPGSRRRPEYRNDESNQEVFFKNDYWHVANENRIRVKDSSFYLEDITGTFQIWDSQVQPKGGFVVDPEARFSCADITYICKDDRKTIRCPRPDFQKLLIVRAIYGQDYACKLSMCKEREGDCTSCYWVTNNDVITTVKAHCNGSLGNCTLQPSDEMFGGEDPCDHIEGDVDTYLRVEHRCVNVPMSLGCYQDDRNNPLLTRQPVSDHNMTIPKCLEYCRSQGYRYAGVANRLFCHCGNQLQNSASRRLPITDCAAPCGGDEFQFCGGERGSHKMEVFEASIGACGGELKTNEGVIYSPDFPRPYPLDQNCVWNIQVSSQNIIRINIELLDISDGDSLTIVEYRSKQTIVTVLNGTSMAEYVSVSSNISLQFQAGPQRAQQTEGFILRYKGVGTCGPIAAADDVISVFPDHGGNFAIGKQASISCKDGRNVTVQCQNDRSFSIAAPYCTDRAKWMAIVGGIVAVLVLLAIVLVVTLYIIRKRRAAQKQHATGTAAYSAAPTSDSLVLTPGNLSARALGGKNEAEDDVHEYASIRDTGPVVPSRSTPNQMVARKNRSS